MAPLVCAFERIKDLCFAPVECEITCDTPELVIENVFLQRLHRALELQWNPGLTGILTGCGQKWGIMRHYEGQLCGKRDQLCDKLCGSQFLISNVLVGCKMVF